jgi:formylglycine-generating enzyme required for sulfatase activity
MLPSLSFAQNQNVAVINFEALGMAPVFTPALADRSGIEFMLIPGGTFYMGNTFPGGFDNEKPVHQVTVSDFYLGRTEVTVAQYRRYCRATNAAMPN